MCVVVKDWNESLVLILWSGGEVGEGCRLLMMRLMRM